MSKAESIKVEISKVSYPINEDILSKYLERFNHSYYYKNSVNSHVKFFLKKYYEMELDNGKSIFEVKKQDIIDYFNFLNSYQSWSLRTKELNLLYVKQFIYHILQETQKYQKTPELDLTEIMKSEDTNEIIKMVLIQQEQIKEQNNRRDFMDYLKNHRNFKWKSEHFHREPNSDFKKVVMTEEEILNVLNYFKGKNFQKYLMFRTLAESGTRKGELLSIDIESKVDGKIISLKDDLDKRIIRVVGKKGKKVYYITENLSNLLKFFLIERMNKNVNTKAFFVSSHGNRFCHCLMNNDMKKARNILGISKHIVPHTFRKTINTLRKNKMGCSNEDAKILLNHKTGDVNIDSYTITNYQEFISKYDKYNPYKNLKL